MPGNFFRALMGRDADALNEEVAREHESRRPASSGKKEQQKLNGKGGLDKPLVWIDCEMTGLGE